MITLIRWGLFFFLAFLTFTFNALNPSYFKNLQPAPSALESDDPPSAPAARENVLMALRYQEDGDLSVSDLPQWERVILTLRQITDGGVKYLGKRMETHIERGNNRSRGYVTLIAFFGIIGGLGLLLGHRRNVAHPHEGPSFSISMLAGKTGLIATAFFASAWLRDLAVANTGEAAILVILLLSITFSGFVGVTVFSRSH